MSTSRQGPRPLEPAVQLARAERAGALQAWLVLLRPRMALMIGLTAVLGAWLADPAAGPLRGLEAALYVTLVAGSASVLNQILERDTDALMERTRKRPLVTGRLRVLDAMVFGVVLAVAGTLGLALSFNLLAALLGLATLAAYVAVYTPLKRVTTLNTVVGAIPGAAPPLLGYVAAAGEVGPWAWSLFAILFAWQFPHFMAIAWMYRVDYARAGHRMLPALPGAEGVAGQQAVLYALALIPVSMLPALGGMAGLQYTVGALVLGLGYLAASVAFACREDRRRARTLLYVSLAYLPLLFVTILLDPVVRSAVGR